MNAGLALRIIAARSSPDADSFSRRLRHASSPRVIGSGICEQLTHPSVAFRSERGIAQPSEGQREIGSVGSHALQQILRQRGIALMVSKKSELAAQTG